MYIHHFFGTLWTISSFLRPCIAQLFPNSSIPVSVTVESLQISGGEATVTLIGIQLSQFANLSLASTVQTTDANGSPTSFLVGPMGYVWSVSGTSPSFSVPFPTIPPGAATPPATSPAPVLTTTSTGVVPASFPNSTSSGPLSKYSDPATETTSTGIAGPGNSTVGVSSSASSVTKAPSSAPVISETVPPPAATVVVTIIGSKVISETFIPTTYAQYATVGSIITISSLDAQSSPVPFLIGPGGLAWAPFNQPSGLPDVPPPSILPSISNAPSVSQSSSTSASGEKLTSTSNDGAISRSPSVPTISVTPGSIITGILTTSGAVATATGVSATATDLGTTEVISADGTTITPSFSPTYLQNYRTLTNSLVIQTTDAGGHQVNLPVGPGGLTWKCIVFCGGGGGGLPPFPGPIPFPPEPPINGGNSNSNPDPSQEPSDKSKASSTEKPSSSTEECTSTITASDCTVSCAAATGQASSSSCSTSCNTKTGCEATGLTTTISGSATSFSLPPFQTDSQPDTFSANVDPAEAALISALLAAGLASLSGTGEASTFATLLSTARSTNVASSVIPPSSSTDIQTTPPESTPSPPPSSSTSPPSNPPPSPSPPSPTVAPADPPAAPSCAPNPIDKVKDSHKGELQLAAKFFCGKYASDTVTTSNVNIAQTIISGWVDDGLFGGDDVARLYTGSSNEDDVYDISVKSVDGCTPSGGYNLDAPVSGNSCPEILHSAWQNCNNKGRGGSIVAGCLVYSVATRY